MLKLLNAVPVAEGSDVKEVYAFYGLAAYQAQVLEKALVNLVVALDADGVPVQRSHFDTLFDRFDPRAFAQLAGVAGARVALSEPAQQLLAEALRRRHHLAHQFYVDHAAAFTTEEGRALMIEELRLLVELLQRASAEVERLYMPLLVKHGMTEARIRQLTEEMTARFVELATAPKQN
jgi:hypothetical protein